MTCLARTKRAEAVAEKHAAGTACRLGEDGYRQTAGCRSERSESRGQLARRALRAGLALFDSAESAVSRQGAREEVHG
eukprot:2821470-Pleurochrysis_carterae.AAC.1